MANWTTIQHFVSVLQSAAALQNYSQFMRGINDTIVSMGGSECVYAYEDHQYFYACAPEIFGTRDYDVVGPFLTSLIFVILFFLIFLGLLYLLKIILCRCRYDSI